MKKKYSIYLGIIMLLFMIFGFVITSLLDFNKTMQDREYRMQLDALARVSSQESLALEEKLSGYLRKLGAMAEYFQDGELHTEKNMEILKNISEQPQQDFQRFALADLEGNSWVSNGARLSVEEQPYFQNALQKKYTITDSKHSKVIDDNHIFIISVPVLDSEEQVKGVLYGVVEVEKFQLHQGDSGEGQGFQVIGRNGDYILRGNIDADQLQSGNLFENFETMDNIKLVQPVEQIQKQIQKGKAFLSEFCMDGRNYVIYFSPLDLNSWYAVTTMDQAQILDYVQEMRGTDIYLVMGKVIGAVALLCGVVFLFLIKEKRDAVRMYQQLKVNDDMIRAAIGKSDVLILIYDLGTKQLRCLNPECSPLPFPAVLDNAPVQLPAMLPGDENTREQVREIFDSLSSIRDTQLFQLAFETGDMAFHYQIQVSSLVDEKDKVFRCIGLAENITEQMVMRREMENFRQKAGTDYLTGLYNRRKGTELMTELLEHMDPEQESHAFIIMDLDNFKGLNDTLGHQMGDAALQDVASVLRRHFRTYDIICRLAGDEFTVLINNIPPEIVYKNLESLLKKMNLSYQNGDMEFQISASAGAAIAPFDGRDFQTLYQKADKALYAAKKKGKQTAVIYSEMQQEKKENERKGSGKRETDFAGSGY